MLKKNAAAVDTAITAIEEKVMQEMERKSLQTMLSNLDDMLHFAEQEEDFVFAARCEDVRIMLVQRIAHADK